jgi:arylsulfatase A-like enzyme
MRLSDEPGPYDDAFGRWLWAQGEDVRERARVTMPGDRKTLEYYTFEGRDETTHASWAATETITFIRDTMKRQPDRPFFVHAGFYAPHPPLNPPQSALDLYSGRPLPPRYYAADELGYLPPNFAQGMRGLLATPEQVWNDYRRHFYAMVTHLDQNVGRIIAALEQAGVWERTIFVMTSDHGDFLGDHNITSKSDRPYDGAMRIPLIFRGPGVPRGKPSDELVEVVDVMPTLVEMLGLEQTAGNQGRSLVPLMQGGPGRSEIYMQGMRNKTLRSKQATYSIYENGEELLFDLAKDPHQLHNIAQTPEGRGLLDEMRKRLLLKTIETRDPLPVRIRPY